MDTGIYTIEIAGINSGKIYSTDMNKMMSKPGMSPFITKFATRLQKELKMYMSTVKGQ